MCGYVCVTCLRIQSKTTQQHEQNSLRQQRKVYYTLKCDCSTSASPWTPLLPARVIAMPNERQGEPRLATVPTKLFYVLEKEEIKQNQSKNIVKSSSLWKIVRKRLLELSTKQREKGQDAYQGVVTMQHGSLTVDVGEDPNPQCGKFSQAISRTFRTTVYIWLQDCCKIIKYYQTATSSF